MDSLTSIQNHFQSLDKRIEQIQNLTGLHCPHGCGKCCENPNVETSPLDWLPQARELAREGKLEKVWEDLDNLAPNSPCYYYIQDPNYLGRGRCGAYQNRPMVCRMFGYSAVRDKYGKKKASICKVHKETQPQEAKRFQMLAENSPLVPVFAEEYWEFCGYKPNYAEQMPINQALKKAIEILSFYPPFQHPNPANSDCLSEAI